MSNLPFDLQHQTDEIEVSAEQESPRSRVLVSAVIVLLLLGLLAAVLFVLMTSLESGRRLARIEALPVDKLVHYSKFADDTQNQQEQLLSRVSVLEKSLTIAEGRLDQTDETSSTMKAALDQNRAHMDDLDVRLKKISDALAAQQKSASDLQRKLAQTHAQSQTPAARSGVQLYSVRSFGHVPAVRLTARTGEISPLLRAGDEWNGWQFLRLDGRKAFFTANGREQVLVL